MNQKRKSTTSSAAAVAAPPERTNVRAQRPSRAYRLQNFLLVWIDASIGEGNNEDSNNTISKLRRIVNHVKPFTSVNECINFITNVKDEKVFVISSGAFGQIVVSAVHDMTQVSDIYIFCGNKGRQEQLVKQWPKVKEIFTDIEPMCEALKRASLECDQNTVSMSFIAPINGTTSPNLDQLDHSFIYTQILKELVLTVGFDQQHFRRFISYYRIQFADNNKELKNIDKLEREYRTQVPVWWYTYHCFLYSMLNRALRTMEVDIIVNMGFFIQSLHKYITKRHSEQYSGHGHLDSLVVYRGQGLSQTDFDQLMKTKGGLLSFNNFLFTSLNRQMSLNFARNTIKSSALGILFVIKIDPSLPSTPFANVRDVSYYQDKEEILFTLHSIFRIGHIKKIDENNRLWQVELTLTSNNDPQLQTLTKRIRKTSFPHMKEWHKLGELLIKFDRLKKAQQLYEILLQQASNDSKIAFINHRLGYIRDRQDKYEEALTFYKKAIEIYETRLSNDQALANSYGSIALVYERMHDYSTALSYYEKDLEISKNIFPPKHPGLATPYDNLGWIYREMGNYSEALSYYQLTLDIREGSLPPNHPDLREARKNIASVEKELQSF